MAVAGNCIQAPAIAEAELRSLLLRIAGACAAAVVSRRCVTHRHYRWRQRAIFEISLRHRLEMPYNEIGEWRMTTRCARGDLRLCLRETTDYLHKASGECVTSFIPAI